MRVELDLLQLLVFLLGACQVGFGGLGVGLGFHQLRRAQRDVGKRVRLRRLCVVFECVSRRRSARPWPCADRPACTARLCLAGLVVGGARIQQLLWRRRARARAEQQGGRHSLGEKVAVAGFGFFMAYLMPFRVAAFACSSRASAACALAWVSCSLASAIASSASDWARFKRQLGVLRCSRPASAAAPCRFLLGQLQVQRGVRHCVALTSWAPRMAASAVIMRSVGGG